MRHRFALWLVRVQLLDAVLGAQAQLRLLHRAGFACCCGTKEDSDPHLE